MEDKTNYNRLSFFEMNEALRTIIISVENKELDLNVKGLNHVDMIKSITALLQSITPEYYTKADLYAFLEIKRIAYRLMSELSVHTVAKDSVHF